MNTTHKWEYILRRFENGGISLVKVFRKERIEENNRENFRYGAIAEDGLRDGGGNGE